jgi:multiple sugar transport system permease protein
MSTERGGPLGLGEVEFYKLKNRVIWGGISVATLVAVVAILTPPYWMLNSSLSPFSLLRKIPPQWVPVQFTFDHYASVLFASQYPRYYVNSIIISLGVLVIVTTLSTLAGYGLTRFNFKQKRNFARMILFGYMFPPILLSIPMFVIWKDIGIHNTYVGAMLAISATRLPLCIWIMWQFFQTVPYSLEESAQMAGASRFRAFYEIALPISKPGIVAVATLAVQGGWNAFTVPKIILIDQTLWPITVGLQSFIKSSTILWPQIMAAVTMGMVPVIVFLYLLHGNWETISV